MYLSAIPFYSGTLGIASIFKHLFQLQIPTRNAMLGVTMALDHVAWRKSDFTLLVTGAHS
jgi:hypothetical protein